MRWKLPNARELGLAERGSEVSNWDDGNGGQYIDLSADGVVRKDIERRRKPEAG